MNITAKQARGLKLGKPASKYGVRNDPAGVAARTRFGIVFDSRREMRRWGELLAMQGAGLVRNLRRQVKYTLIPRQDGPDGKMIEQACTVTLDHVYEERGDVILAGYINWVKIYEDVKGFPNDRWPLKRKLLLHVNGIRVRVVK